MSVLVTCRFQKTHCGKISCIDRIEEVMSIVLMIGAVAVAPDPAPPNLDAHE